MFQEYGFKSANLYDVDSPWKIEFVSFLDPIENWVSKPYKSDRPETAIALNRDVIWSGQGSIEFIKNIYGLKIDSLTPVGIEKYLYGLNSGFQIKFPEILKFTRTQISNLANDIFKYFITDFSGFGSVFSVYSEGQAIYNKLVDATLTVLILYIGIIDAEDKALQRSFVIAKKTAGMGELDPRSTYDWGLFKNQRNYMIVGDEPLPPSGSFYQERVYTGDLKLSDLMSEDQTFKLKVLLAYIPRAYLKSWFDREFAPSIEDKSHLDFVWGGILNLFNEANRNYSLSNNLSPYEWESQKLYSFSEQTRKDSEKAIHDQFNSLEAQKNLDPKAMKLLVAYSKLPRLGDIGLEINRQNAVNELLKMKEYDLVQAVIDAYRYAGQTELSSALTSKIPFDIKDESGREVKATP